MPGSAVLTVRHLTSQSVPPETWLKAVGELGYACLIVATRPWPEGAEPDDVETLAAFTSDEDVLTSAAHVVLPPAACAAELRTARATRAWPGPCRAGAQPDRAASTTDLASSCTRRRWSGPRNDSA